MIWRLLTLYLSLDLDLRWDERRGRPSGLCSKEKREERGAVRLEKSPGTFSLPRHGNEVASDAVLF